MSTEHHKNSGGEIRLPLHEDVSFETRDIRSGLMLKLLAWMGVVIVLSYVFTIGIYRGLTHYWESARTPMMPSRVGMQATMPPEPMLQGMPGHLSDPQEDWRNKLAADMKENSSYGWVDEKNGIAKIPVEDAMKIIAEKGLPGFGTAPAEKK
jgi:hypothetical protein